MPTIDLRPRPRPAVALALLLTLVSGACSLSGSSDDDDDGGSSSGGSSAIMFIESCSLGCNNGSGGAQVFCEIADTYINQDISVLFSQPVDPFSVGAGSFRVVKVGTGTAPPGSYAIDPLNPNRVIFRPRLSFDIDGNPQFGFEPDTNYQITIPGEEQGDSGPFVLSTTGRPNQSRLQCTIDTSQGVIDLVPGRPIVTISVDVVVRDGFGNPIGILPDQPLPPPPAELDDVSSGTDIVLRFNDIMNVATLANPLTGEGSGLAVQVDADGDLGTDFDRVQLEGSFDVDVDLNNLSTTATFTPSLGLPSAGEGPDPRRIIVSIFAQAVDLSGKSVSDDVVLSSFVPEQIAFGEIELPKPGGEDFVASGTAPGSIEDVSRSGADWGGGRLARGMGGGAGRLGDLHVRNGEVVVIDTDSQVFPLLGDVPSILGNKDAFGRYPGQDLWDSNGNGMQGDDDPFTVTDGAFEFARLRLDTGGVLRFAGNNPARLFACGPLLMASGSRIDVSGGSPAPHDSTITLPEAGITLVQDEMGTIVTEPVPAPMSHGGPAAGDGGYGGDRHDHTGHFSVLNLSNANDRSDALEIGLITGEVAVGNGRSGGGVGRAVALGEGLGGVGFPAEASMPTGTNTATEGGTIAYNEALDPIGVVLTCFCKMVGGSGSGAAYAIDGTAGHSVAPLATADAPMGAANAPADTPMGTAGSLGLAPPDESNTGYLVRKLDYKAGHLRGGAGGGGAGNHPHFTLTDGVEQDLPCIDAMVKMTEWHDHSGCPGGGGGGAIQIVSGEAVAIAGVVDASGGDGGSPVQFSSVSPFGVYALPGGAGSGGAVRLQAPTIDLANSAGRLDVSGGLGGAAPWSSTLTRGGNGSPGLVRIEDAAGVASRAELAPSIRPFEPSDNSLSWVSVAPGEWAPLRERPESFSASTSCWIRPEGNFFELNFADDVGNDPDTQGWNMDVLWAPTMSTIPFRGFDPSSPAPYNTQSFERVHGNLINHDQAPTTGSPVAVRFQGARVIGEIDDLCDLELDDPAIVEGSVTPWVQHPAELNSAIFTPKPNMIRFTVVFDSSLFMTLVDNVLGITNLRITANPD